MEESDFNNSIFIHKGNNTSLSGCFKLNKKTKEVLNEENKPIGKFEIIKNVITITKETYE